MRKLTHRQQRFVEEYLVDLNGTAAARRVGYGPGSASSAASRMLKTAHVRAAIDAALALRAREARVSARAVIDELAAVAFFDPGALFDEAGELIAPNRLDRTVRAGMGAIEITHYGETARTPARRAFRVRPGEKVRSLALLARHLGAAPAAKTAAQAEAEDEARAAKIMDSARFDPLHNGALAAKYLHQAISHLDYHAAIAERHGRPPPDHDGRRAFVQETARRLVQHFLDEKDDQHRRVNEWWRARQAQGWPVKEGWVDDGK